jgi:creatinine amidohydrolase/Fe(II)-dependent formamide hydrolase-like protein
MSEREVPRAVLWQKLRRGEIRVAADAGGLAFLPLGAIEQHGPHLPLDTDSVTAFTVCARAAELVREFPVLVLPPSGGACRRTGWSFPGP